MLTSQPVSDMLCISICTWIQYVTHLALSLCLYIFVYIYIYMCLGLYIHIHIVHMFYIQISMYICISLYVSLAISLNIFIYIYVYWTPHLLFQTISICAAFWDVQMSYLQPPPWHPINGEASVLSWVALSRVLLGLAVLSLDVLSLAVLNQFFLSPLWWIVSTKWYCTNKGGLFEANTFITWFIYEHWRCLFYIPCILSLSLSLTIYTPYCYCY